jgi:ubiquitin-like 1-activating enzyme E1 B
VDLEKATLNDLVESVLRAQLGYGDEISVTTDAGVIYDPDLEDNLPKRLEALGVKGEVIVTIVDEDDDAPRVNLELVVAERYVCPRPQQLKSRAYHGADLPKDQKLLNKTKPLLLRRK